MSESDTKQRVYRALVQQKGSYISGEQLSSDLSLSRTAIWKAITTLRKRGFIIHSSPGLGYCLAGSTFDMTQELLNHELLKSDEIGISQVHYLETITSTNDLAKEMARAGCPSGTLIVADTQTAGRGRLSRQWSSPAGKGLWFSLVLRPNKLPLMEATRVTGAVAIAVAEGINNTTGLRAQVKWPNDIFINRRKASGILIEISAEVDSVSWVVIGVGLNINADEYDLPLGIRETATSLMIELGNPVDRVVVLKSVIRLILQYTSSLTSGGWSHILQKLREMSCVIGERVTVSSPDGNTMNGTALSLNDDGTLTIHSDENGIDVVVNVGDVSLRVG